MPHSFPLLALLACGAGVLGCGSREVGGDPPPSFAVLRELDRTADPACEHTWVAGMRGRVIDDRGLGVAGAVVHHCLRTSDGAFECTERPPADESGFQQAVTDAAGWYAYVVPDGLRCVDALTVQVVHPEEPYATTTCPVPLAPDDGVQLLPHPAVLQAVSPPADRPPLGDSSAARDVRFEGGVVLTGVVPEQLVGATYEALAGAPVPLASRPCYLPTGPGEPELLGLYTFAPAVGSSVPVAFRLPNDHDLPEGAAVVILGLGGLDSVRVDGSAIPLGELEPIAAAVVRGAEIVGEATELPMVSVIGWAAFQPTGG